MLQACRAVLAPLARLAIGRGLHHADLDEMLRIALVDAALAAHPEASPSRAVSRVSTATGLHRREVDRLLARAPMPAGRRSPATQVFTRWLSDPEWRKRGRLQRCLPRAGVGQTFEALAQSVTRDVHPRSLLAELCRLGLVRVDDAGEQVELLHDRYAPVGDEPRMLGFLAANVGDHLQAAVANVLDGDEPRHLEQALFADELSAKSVQQIQPLVRAQWQQMLRVLAPEIQKLIDDDAAQGRVQDQRVRVGLYGYAQAMRPEAGAPPLPPPAPPPSPVKQTGRKSTRRSKT